MTPSSMSSWYSAKAVHRWGHIGWPDGWQTGIAAASFASSWSASAERAIWPALDAGIGPSAANDRRHRPLTAPSLSRLRWRHCGSGLCLQGARWNWRIHDDAGYEFVLFALLFDMSSWADNDRPHCHARGMFRLACHLVTRLLPCGTMDPSTSHT